MENNAARPLRPIRRRPVASQSLPVPSAPIIVPKRILVKYSTEGMTEKTNAEKKLKIANEICRIEFKNDFHPSFIRFAVLNTVAGVPEARLPSPHAWFLINYHWREPLPEGQIHAWEWTGEHWQVWTMLIRFRWLILGRQDIQ